MVGKSKAGKPKNGKTKAGKEVETSAAKKLRTTVHSRAQQKLSENLRVLSPYEQDVVLDPATKQTCRQRVEADVRLRDAGFPGA